jgi:hypothetical protein
MKFHYAVTLTVLLVMLMIGHHKLAAQCPVGFPPGSTAFDTTILTPAGINTMEVKFPKFNPAEGMLTCVRLCISITGVVDSVSVENNSASPQTADVYYIRTDQLTGPGLVTPLTNSVNHHYGPYALGASTAPLGSGPDFTSISRDTVLNAVQVCRTLSDSATIMQFYGLDSVSFTYNITAFTNVSCTGGNYNSTVATSAFVRFRFEYCTCPGVILPVNIYHFSVKKIGAAKVELKWNGFDNAGTNGNYHYEAQVSRDGMHFETIGILPKQANNGFSYSYLYDLRNPGRYFFRIKQVNEDGRSYLSNIKYVDAGSDGPFKFNLYPNPSSGIVGIKFDNNSAGKYLVLINNAQGQTVVTKEIEVAGNGYQQVATLLRGFYWVKVVNVSNQLSSVNQLLIK